MTIKEIRLPNRDEHIVAISKEYKYQAGTETMQAAGFDELDGIHLLWMSMLCSIPIRRWSS